MKSFFFSLRASYLFFALLSLLFWLGNRLAAVQVYDTLFREMTATHLVQCLGAIAGQPLVLVWLVVFMATGACLFVNTLCCTYSQIKLLKRLRDRTSNKRRRSVQMTLIHIAALMVIVLHALDITVIQRHQPIRLYEGQTAVMGGYRVRVSSVSYVTDTAVIRENKKGKRKKMFRIPADQFSVKDNFAQVQIEPATLPENALDTASVHELRMMSPVRVGADYFFLAGFFIARGTDRIGVQIHHSFNPLAALFFLVYTALFGLLILRYATIRREIS